MSKELLVKVAEQLAEEAVELIPIGIKALGALLEGKDPSSVLTQAERDIIAKKSQDVFDDALANAKGDGT